MTIIAFVVGAGLAAAIASWRNEQGRARPATASLPAIIEQPTTVTLVAPAVSAARVGERNTRTPATAGANPFQRVPRGATPDPRRTWRATVPSTATYVAHQVPFEQAPVVTHEWVRRLRKSCAQYAEQERAACEKIAARIERILARTTDVDEQWVSGMEEELQRLFSSSTRAKDFSLTEVTCNTDGCILYWHSSDYADWQGAGNVLLKDLFERSSFADFDLQNVERLGAFDPTTSIPWEVLVLERRQAGPGSD